MIDFEKELVAILKDDPLGLLLVKPKETPAMTTDIKLRESFEEIKTFVQENGNEPEKSRDIQERRLYSRLQGIRENPDKVIALLDFDSLGLLGEVVTTREPEQVYDVVDVLDNDPLGLLDGEDPAESIFTLTHVFKSADKPDFVARRKECKEFSQFEPMFTQVHAALGSGDKKMRPFVSEKHIIKGAVFLLQGMLVYVANIGNKEDVGEGKINARLYCVFENGTESNMLLRSLAAALWKDEGSRHIVDASQMEMFDKSEGVGTEDEATGCIYVLKSLSDDPDIRDMADLYKIGFSSGPVQERIQNAAQDPTYLMADVKLVTEYKTFNLNPQKMELLLHTFFAKSCLSFDVYDGEGKRHNPREWFIVPLHVVESVVRLLISGEIIYYCYDHEQQEIVEK